MENQRNNIQINLSESREELNPSLGEKKALTEEFFIGIEEEKLKLKDIIEKLSFPIEEITSNEDDYKGKRAFYNVIMKLRRKYYIDPSLSSSISMDNYFIDSERNEGYEEEYALELNKYLSMNSERLINSGRYLRPNEIGINSDPKDSYSSEEIIERNTDVYVMYLITESIINNDYSNPPNLMDYVKSITGEENMKKIISPENYTLRKIISSVDYTLKKIIFYDNENYADSDFMKKNVKYWSTILKDLGNNTEDISSLVREEDSFVEFIETENSAIEEKKLAAYIDDNHFFYAHDTRYINDNDEDSPYADFLDSDNKEKLKSILFDQNIGNYSVLEELINIEANELDEDGLVRVSISPILDYLDRLKKSPLLSIFLEDNIYRYKHISDLYNHENCLGIDSSILRPPYEYNPDVYINGLDYEEENYDDLTYYRKENDSFLKAGVRISQDYIISQSGELMNVNDFEGSTTSRTYEKGKEISDPDNSSKKIYTGKTDSDKFLNISSLLCERVRGLYIDAPVLNNLDKVSKKVGVNLKSLHLEEQVQFINYLSDINPHDWEKMQYLFYFKKDLSNLHLVKSFLSLDKGGLEMGQKILDTAEKLPSESANAIFEKYSELIDATKGLEDFVTREFSTEIAKNPKILEEVRQKLLQKGVEVLNIFHSKIDHISGSGNDQALAVVTEALSKISTNALATLSTFKYARKNGLGLSLEDIKNSEFKRQDRDDISTKDQEEMVGIYKENYSDDPELSEQLVDKFNQSFASSNEGEFYTYRIDGKLNAFVRFENSQDGKFASALNVDKAAQGYSLGEAMMEQALTAESQDYILYAEANLNSWNTPRYLELGFNAVESNNKYDVPVVNIVWDRSLNEKLESRALSEADIFSKKVGSDDVYIETYNNINDFDRSRLGDLIMTRSLYNPEDQKWYVVLEKKGQTK
jgi:hypothetical protein